MKTRDERLSNDSCSEITDLSTEDILATSTELLSKKEQEQLEKYNQMFRRIVRNHSTVGNGKHHCRRPQPKE